MNRPELRLVLAVSLDGRLAPPEGGAAQLGGAGDRRALEEALVWADACLIGAQTLRLHGSTCLIHAADLLEERRSQGRPGQPDVVVVSRCAEGHIVGQPDHGLPVLGVTAAQARVELLLLIRWKLGMKRANEARG